jgi:hypothetical protein
VVAINASSSVGTETSLMSCQNVEVRPTDATEFTMSAILDSTVISLGGLLGYDCRRRHQR